MGRGVRDVGVSPTSSRGYPTAPGLGPRVREARRAAGLTQSQLAEPAYTREYVSLVESGRAHPSIAALTHFAGRIGVTLATLAHPGGKPLSGLAALSEATELLRAAAEATESDSERRALQAAELAMRGVLQQLVQAC